MWPRAIPRALISVYATLAVGAVDLMPFSSFSRSCERRLSKPLTRFWGSRPHPDRSMIASNALWSVHDRNLEILPRWQVDPSYKLTMPFMDTHVAVRFLGGVSPFSVATSPGCIDSVAAPEPSGVDRNGVWCDLVTRASDGSLQNRFDLVRPRLDRYVDNGMDVLIVLDNVPWAFVAHANRTGPCFSFGCQYLPPDRPAEFASWVGELATFLVQSYGLEWSSRVRWRLGTEANGPRWSDHGKFFSQYVESYKACMRAIRSVLPHAQVGASNWVQVVGTSGNLSANGSDAFQYHFYKELAKDTSIPLDWVSISHYGTGLHTNRGHAQPLGNFPGADYVQRTPSDKAGLVEVEAMRQLARRPEASLEVQEWSILTNERGQGTYEPSSLGTAWSAMSTATWVCHGVDRIFHWETGTTLRNTSGDNREVNFFEQHAWNMAFLELFVGGATTITTYEAAHPAGLPLNHSMATIESLVNGSYYVLIASVGADRDHPFSTKLRLRAHSAAGLDGAAALQYRMDASVSVVETVVRELQGKPGMLQHTDGLPYDFGRLLTPAGFNYAQMPENLERYWRMHAQTFQPSPFAGKLRPIKDGIKLEVEVTAPSVTVIVVPRAQPPVSRSF